MSSQPETEWDDIEREWWVALAQVRQQEEAERCHLCGLPKSVCRARSAEKDVRVEVERCHVATAVDRTREQYEKDGMPNTRAVDWIPQIKNPMAGLEGLTSL